MKATLPWLGALLIGLAGASLAQANNNYYGYYYPNIPQAPDACGYGFYCTNRCGQVYGPNYYVRPPWQPVGGIQPSINNQNRFPSHPFARSPRDFFMVD
jgi:hypothetical protein